jgi:putative ABC transport system permease protein
LKSPDYHSAFEAEIREKGLPDDWIVFRDEAAYRRMIAPIENLQDVSLTFLLVVLLFGAAVMTLLSVIAIRERKYEIGVLRAMGMKKKKVALGLWFETILITCICFIFGMITGTALATPVSNMLWSGDGQISIALNAITAVQILGVSLLLATIAGAVSVSRITKYEPIKILMERN